MRHTCSLNEKEEKKTNRITHGTAKHARQQLTHRRYTLSTGLYSALGWKKESPERRDQRKNPLESRVITTCSLLMMHNLQPTFGPMDRQHLKQPIVMLDFILSHLMRCERNPKPATVCADRVLHINPLTPFAPTHSSDAARYPLTHTPTPDTHSRPSAALSIAHPPYDYRVVKWEACRCHL